MKRSYETPETTVLEMKTDGILCLSYYSSIWFFNSTNDEWGRNGYDAGGDPATWN